MQRAVVYRELTAKCIYGDFLPPPTYAPYHSKRYYGILHPNSQHTGRHRQLAHLQCHAEWPQYRWQMYAQRLLDDFYAGWGVLDGFLQLVLHDGARNRHKFVGGYVKRDFTIFREGWASNKVDVPKEKLDVSAEAVRLDVIEVDFKVWCDIRNEFV